ncbi:CRM-domain containing factor CFM3, chloroplastic/mitochondrial [Neltuma alba]|uniref:CRM-domain containing factor CFM3, chloroplastic/mitochondrial n=1 Tax=Neltuma alba TaxID=207710 RepID=UPI0010A4E844|nr:CRM-domain containing factor CFM3, chloroplastic/mitochondrial [Prosopis alba]XP_028787006.1 CRM-domain containing factor CFM3, chloroplastic/mitochondrial [Prosopis alba]
MEQILHKFNSFQLKMALTGTKLSEFPLKTSLPLTYRSSAHSCASFCHSKLSFRILRPSSSLRTTEHSGGSYSSSRDARDPKHSPKSKSPAAPWITKWPSSKPPTELPNRKDNRKVAELNAEETVDQVETRFFDKDKGQNAIERIVLRLRNLGIGSDEEEEEEQMAAGGRDELPLTGEERLSDLLRREWVRPDAILAEDQHDETVLPWERGEEKDTAEDGEGGLKKRRIKAPTLAELTLEDEELRRLRRIGMNIRERISVPKAGITQAVLEKIHEKWRKEELVRLKFHEVLARDMKTAHEIVERRTGGLVIWRSGSVMMVYRGSHYEGPTSRSQPNGRDVEDLFVPNISTGNLSPTKDSNATSSEEKSEPVVRNHKQAENMTEEEAEYNGLLDGLGPRFVEWWGTGILPVDADLLPPTVPGYKTPFRLLPTGMRSRLTNAEMTNLRKVAKSLPCHFALGRNRNHQGLACAILKLWEKSLVAKIAVKRGIQNTNNKLMADELKKLTGGTLLLRNKYYIVMYRGKDFVPTSVAAVLAERAELAKQVQDVEEKMRSEAVDTTPSTSTAQAGSLAEFYEAQARWGREISTEEREKMMEEAAKAKSVRLVKQIEHKLNIAQVKKVRAERLLAKIEASMVPAGPDYDQETITDEECVMFRRVGLRMKPYLPLGIRGVFDGVIENMHLHWKHRELVKLITKQKTLAFVEDTARLLEYESGGILVAIERVPKGYAIIYYRGKNYRRPISLRPRNLLTKAKALKRSVAMQRHEALSQHITELEKTIGQMKKELGMSQDQLEDSWGIEDHNQMNPISEFSQSDDEDSDGYNDVDYDDEEDNDWEDDENSDS